MGTLVVLLLAGLFFFTLKSRRINSLSQYRETLRAQGEKLTYADLVGTNGVNDHANAGMSTGEIWSGPDLVWPTAVSRSRRK